MKNRFVLSMTPSFVMGLMMVTAAAAFAQQDGPPPGGMGMGGGRFGRPGMGGMGPGGKVVAGAPYSADVNSQSVQTLPDGNTISRNTSGHVARDSQGRTYSQETITGGFMGASGPMIVTFISDPVAGYSYVLNSTTKVATRMQKRTPPQGASAWPQGAPDHMGHGNRAGNGPFGPDASNTTVTDLTTQSIGGVSAVGKSITHTVPAGVMGNSQPIVSTGETWTSPDLQIIVLAKHNDPRMGQSTYAVQNIMRAEPAASLFQVPSDYTVQDGKPGIAGPGLGGHRPPQ